MSAKSVAFLIVGMLVVSSVFFFFHVAYPSNPAEIKIQFQPKNLTLPKMVVFQNQTLNLPRLGLNQTSFTPTGNTSLLMQGYAWNTTQGNPISNQNLGIAVLAAFTTVKTDSNGFYQVKVLSSGQGVFAFKAFQYNEAFYNVFIGQNSQVLWKNVTLQPQQKYNISGTTVSHSQPIADVGLEFSDFWGTYSTTSTSSASYSVQMVDSNYTIKAIKPGFSTTPNPQSVTVSNSDISGYTVSLNSTATPEYYISGYVFNQLGLPVSNALVHSSPAGNSTLTDANGYYNVSAAYYLNTLLVSATGYANATQYVTVPHNLTDQNITISSQDPFELGKNTGSLNAGYPPGMPNDTSSVNYQSLKFITISGQVISTQTQMPVPDTQFQVYTSVNGTYFYYKMTTGPNGNYTIYLEYPGNFNFTITSLKFFETYLSKDVFNSLSNVPIYVETNPSNIYHINGSIFNGLNNQSLGGAIINITGPGGQVLKTIYTNSTGNYSFSTLGGNYTLNITYPGFNSTTVPLNVSGNTSKNVGISPTTGISTGSSLWSPNSGSGLPGVNSTSISSQLNNTQRTYGNATTTSSLPANLTLRFYNNETKKPIENTSYILYIKVNGLILKTGGVTNSTGYSVLPLNYGGTYIILPEMLDYSGTSEFVNTSSSPQPVVFNMTPLTTYGMDVKLVNPLGVYTGSGVPLSGLTVGGYALPITPTSYYEGTNYSLSNYTVPNGTYSFSYNNAGYVPSSWTVNISGQANTSTVTLKPFTLQLSWSASTTWAFTLSGPAGFGPLTNSTMSYSGSSIIALEAGSFTFTSSIGGAQTNNSQFQISDTAYTESLSYSVSTGSTVLNHTAYNLTASGTLTLGNTLVPNENAFIYQVQVPVGVNLSADTVLTLDTTQFRPSIYSAGYFNLTKYFAITTSVQTPISIESYNYGGGNYNPTKVTLTVNYYVASLR